MNNSNEELHLSAAADIVSIVADLVYVRREISEGELYALLMGSMDFQAFRQLATSLERTGLVRKEGHLFRWVGGTDTLGN